MNSTPITKEQIARFLQANSILIVDPQAASRSAIKRTLTDLGADPIKVVESATFDHAVQEVQRIRPQILISEFQLDKHSGFDLMQLQKDELPLNKDHLILLITSNSSQSGLSRASEEEVDSFLVKPFTHETLKHGLTQALTTKISPTEYSKTISVGKEHLSRGEFDQALACFKKASALETTPTLALAYEGHASIMKNALDPRGAHPLESLKLSKLPFRCLQGLFEAFQKSGKLEEAFEIAKRLVQHFPANQQRLAAALRLGISLGKFEDIEYFYRTFNGLNQRSEELVRIMCSALSVTAKHYLTLNSPARASGLFETVRALSPPKTTVYLRFIVETLTSFQMFPEAKTYLGYFPPEASSSTDKKVCELLLSDVTDQPVETIQKAKDLMQSGIVDSLLFRILIQRSFEAGYSDQAATLLEQARQLWPKLAAEFEASSPKKP